MFQLAKGAKLVVREDGSDVKKTVFVLPSVKTVSASAALLVLVFTAIFTVKAKYDAIPVLQAADAKQKAQIIVNTKSLRLLRVQLVSQEFMMSELIKKNFPGAEGSRILAQAKALEDQLRIEIDRESEKDRLAEEAK